MQVRDIVRLARSKRINNGTFLEKKKKKKKWGGPGIEPTTYQYKGPHRGVGTHRGAFNVNHVSVVLTLVHFITGYVTFTLPSLYVAVAK